MPCRAVRTKDEGCEGSTEFGNQNVPGNLKKSSFTGKVQGQSQRTVVVVLKNKTGGGVLEGFVLFCLKLGVKKTA